MAIFHPDYFGVYDEDMPSSEIKFYEACSELDDTFHVFHSVAWISKSNGKTRDGEADFLIAHPDKGLVVVEIKGGRIRADYNIGKWYSTDRHGRAHEIKDPFRQATNNKFNLLSKLKEHRDWSRLGLRHIPLGHAVFFSDVDDGRSLKGPNAPVEIIGDRAHLSDMKAWIENVYGYWQDGEPSGRQPALGAAGISLVNRVFARAVEAKPLLSAQLDVEEKERLKLTQRQVQILDLLSRQRRVSISGGAGTGKTVLAVEKARRLADEGFRTLLTCYNRPLAHHLETICDGVENLEVSGFHKLCKTFVDRAHDVSGRDLLAEAKDSYPGQDFWDHYYPIALAYALDIIGDRYDAIVVDEGQDFGEEYWLPIELLLSDSANSPLYIFHDENQNVYTRVNTFPADTSPITLTFNCRNTRNIHDLAYRFYNGEPVEPPDLVGEEIVILDADGMGSQAKKIRAMINRLIATERIPASSITVLIADRIHRNDYEMALKSQPPAPGARWRGAEEDGTNGVTLETVARFKGLESEVLILWGLDDIPDQERSETHYVGMSRAKSLLVLCGANETCQGILRSHSGNLTSDAVS